MENERAWIAPDAGGKGKTSTLPNAERILSRLVLFAFILAFSYCTSLLPAHARCCQPRMSLKTCCSFFASHIADTALSQPAIVLG
jgi:hypothetical protein